MINSLPNCHASVWYTNFESFHFMISFSSLFCRWLKWWLLLSFCTRCVGSHYTLCNWLQMKTPKYSSTWKIFDTSGSVFKHSLPVIRVIILSFTFGWIENSGKRLNCSSCDVCAAQNVVIIHTGTFHYRHKPRWPWLGS